MLRFRDNTLILSASSLERICACPKQAYYSLVRERILAEPSPALRLGQIIHVVLAFRFRCEFHKLPYEKYFDAICTRLFRASPCENEEYRNLAYASQALRGYNQAYPDPRGVIGLPSNPRTPFVEQPFACDAGTINGVRVVYIGVIDLVLQHSQQYFIEDHKTTSIEGQSFWDDLAVSEQQWGYCWAFQKTTGLEAAGYIVDALILRKPTKTGVAIEFKRQTNFISEPPGKLSEWHSNMMAQCEEFLFWHKKDHFPMFRKGHCVHKYGKCDYYDVCTLPVDQRETLLQSAKYKPHKMNPRYT